MTTEFEDTPPARPQVPAAVYSLSGSALLPQALYTCASDHSLSRRFDYLGSNNLPGYFQAVFLDPRTKDMRTIPALVRERIVTHARRMIENIDTRIADPSSAARTRSLFENFFMDASDDGEDLGTLLHRVHSHPHL